MEPGLKRHKVEMSVPSLGTSPDSGNHMHRTSLESSLMVWKISVAGSRLSPRLETELFLPTLQGKLLDDREGFSRGAWRLKTATWKGRGWNLYFCQILFENSRLFKIRTKSRDKHIYLSIYINAFLQNVLRQQLSERERPIFLVHVGEWGYSIAHPHVLVQIHYLMIVKMNWICSQKIILHCDVYTVEPVIYRGFLCVCFIFLLGTCILQTPILSMKRPKVTLWHKWIIFFSYDKKAFTWQMASSEDYFKHQRSPNAVKKDCIFFSIFH